MLRSAIMYIFHLILLLALSQTAMAHQRLVPKKSYEGWALIKAKPVNKEQLSYLKSLKDDDSKVRILQKGTLKRAFHIVMHPEERKAFISGLERSKITYLIETENINDQIRMENQEDENFATAKVKNGKWFKKYLNLDEMYAAIDELAIKYPRIVKIVSIGTTHEHRPIKLVEVSTTSGRDNKPGIWIDGGIHAREWISPATVLFILNELLTGKNKGLVNGANWYFVPILNPDGYAYSHFSDRFWRKNRRHAPQDSSTRKRKRACDGVDLNRNFGYDFEDDTGSSTDPCDCEYRGPHAFSEPETQAVKRFLENHKNVQAFITIHSFGQKWVYPFGNRRGFYPADADDLQYIAEEGTKTLKTLYGTDYEVGTSADAMCNHEASGNSDDWAKFEAGIKYSYTLELRPHNDVSGSGFILRPRYIIPTGKETWAGLRVLFDEVISSVYTLNRKLASVTIE